MKKINLARALCYNVNCRGFIWKFSDGTYGYQNDNDLGLDLTELGFSQPYKRKVFLRPHSRDYVYEIEGCYDPDDTGAPLNTIKALLLECHGRELTPKEARLCKKYWDQFWGK